MYHIFVTFVPIFMYARSIFIKCLLYLCAIYIYKESVIKLVILIKVSLENLVL